MSRTKGSLNKSTILAMQQANKNKNAVYNIKMAKQVEGSAITRKSGQGFVNWGLRNNMPTLLLDLYNQSPTHRACITFEVQSIVGGGVDTEAMKIDGSQIAPNYYQDWDTFLRAIALDYSLYGSYCIEIIMNKDRKTYSFYHIPLDKIRWSEFDTDGQITSYWVCNDWSEMGVNPPIQLPAFDMKEDSKIKYGQPYLYVYRPYTPTMTYYTQPTYQAAIKSIESEIQYCNYDLRNIVNGFTPQGVLTLPSAETEEERDAIIANVTRMFTGSENANSVMITFRNNIEDKGVEYVPFAKNQGSFNFYADANERVIDRIISSHQIPSKTLVGLSQGNNGFNSEGAFLESAYTLYNTLVGNYNRNAIIKTINYMFKMNGIDQEIILKPLTFRLDDSQQQPTNDTDSRVDESDVNDNRTDNIEEQVTE